MLSVVIAKLVLPRRAVCNQSRKAKNVSLFERVIRRSEMWLELLDRERDAAMRAKPERTHQSWQVWIDRLEAERRDVVALIDELKLLQHRRPLLFDVRPARMLKAKKQPTRQRKRA